MEGLGEEEGRRGQFRAWDEKRERKYERKMSAIWEGSKVGMPWASRIDSILFLFLLIRTNW